MTKVQLQTAVRFQGSTWEKTIFVHFDIYFPKPEDPIACADIIASAKIDPERGGYYPDGLYMSLTPEQRETVLGVSLIPVLDIAGRKFELAPFKD